MPVSDDERRDLYRRWLRFPDRMATWAFEPDASPAEFQRETDDLMADIELLASVPVQAAIRNYFDHVQAGNAALQSTAQPNDDIDSQRATAATAFASAMQPYREAVVSAMRQDIGAL